MSKTTRISLLGIALGSALALASLAAGQHQGRPRGERHGFRSDPMGARGPMSMLRELDLSDDQRQQIRALFDQVEASGALEKLREARESLHDAIESGADEANLRQQASVLGEAEGDAAVEWTRVRARIQEILTPEQKQELEQLKEQAEERREMLRRHHEERKARSGKSGADLL